MDLRAKLRLTYMWKSESRSQRLLSRLEEDLRYVSETEGMQARLPFVMVAE